MSNRNGSKARRFKREITRQFGMSRTKDVLKALKNKRLKDKE